ncbi:Protein-L-isoaspartate O-methyltransferase domain-containing protein 1 [Frankliniella fusca]|uniref:Protein-L-isoaspartate O-methyltransferase domain-containing protein 1 n=1 Tax=Frankliniella fusca TaxID=407009 RepID=A0AAE1I0E3_9NEOP|nr:Protein-L-isoaspartate O-methyltransferase domain-containing protein 1 [Frankliniella fusca]
MGGSVSTGVDNDDLVDNLYVANYIKTPSVERVFRAVDRAMYFTPLGRDSAYKDLAWKNGNIHLSAPCIYSEVMENLSLGPGMSFLNLGSGTGYLSTMAGLILGSFGINHGVEIHQDVIRYAHEKLEEFKKTSSAIDEFDFCEPKFVEGNCLQLDSCSMKYDRVYCGAACPPSYEAYMKNLIKVGGILVVPLNDRLLRITRVSETVWETRSVLPVAFANLVGVTASNIVILPKVEPIPLMDACRTTIRSILQAAVDHEHPELKCQSSLKTKSKKNRTLQRIFIPLMPSESVVFLNPNDGSDLSRGDGSDIANTDRALDDDADISLSPSIDTSRYRLCVRREARSSSDSDDSSTDSSLASISRVERAIYQAVTVADELFPGISSSLTPDNANSDSSAVQDDSSDSMEVDLNEAESDTSKASPNEKRSEGRPTGTQNKRKEAEMEETDITSAHCVRRSSQASSSSSSASEVKERNSSIKSGAKREKVDSGISEDINNWDISPDLSSNSSGEETNNSFKSVSDMDLESDSDSDEEGTQTEKTPKKVIHGKGKKRARPAQDHKQIKTREYVKHMRSKIQQLPLPQSIKLFLNFYRDL